MNSPLARFLLLAALLTGLCAAFMAFWKNTAQPELVMQSGYVFLLAVAVTSALPHIYLLVSAGGNAQAFVRRFMGGTVLKFFVYIGIIMGYMLFTPESKKAVVLYFLMAYIPFTLLEVSTLYTELRKAGTTR
jgi:hypothetical protein